jgi:hypothetical protein
VRSEEVPVRTLTILTVLAALGLAVVPADAEDEELNFLEKALSGLRLGKAMAADQIVIFPLIAEEKPESTPIVSARRSADFRITELPWPERPYDVELSNEGARPVLLLGGSNLVGGRLDRLVPRDILLPGKHQAEVETLPAEYPKDRRAKPPPFRMGDTEVPAVLSFRIGNTVAPAFLRERAAFDPSRNLVPIFVSHFLEFRNEGDTRRSLAAIDDARALAVFCLACQQAFAKFPDIAESRVVGFMAAVRGRILVVEIFGTNDLLRSHFAPIVDALTYDAAAIELRAKKLGIPIPGRDDPERTLAVTRKAAEELLAELGRSRYRERSQPPGTFGKSFFLRNRESQGTALGYQDRLVHAAIYPHNPFEEALYSRPFEPPQERSGGEETFGELERREDRGTLTEYEKRLLERIRRRR